MKLLNGATIEVIGICENPTYGRHWWGPDGSELDDEPYTSYERYDALPADRTIYEIAWHVHAPQGKEWGVSVSPEGNSRSYYREIIDRYGNPLPGGARATAYAFDKSRTKMMLRIGVQDDSGQFAWMTFKDISLVRGESHGFEIIEDEATE